MRDICLLLQTEFDKKFMILKFVFIFLFFLAQVIVLGQHLPEEIDVAAFYTAFASDDLASINSQLEIINPQDALSKAYTGALLMKKAGKVKKPKEKLETFKEGKELLDGTIAEHPENAEFRFLRLVIQEQAPAILNYNDKKEDDAQKVIEHYDAFPEVLKNFVKEYAQNSETLGAHDFE